MGKGRGRGRAQAGEAFLSSSYAAQQQRVFQSARGSACPAAVFLSLHVEKF